MQAVLLANRAASHKAQRNFDEAVADLSQALDQDAAYIKALVRRGQCYLELELLEEALTDFSSAQSKDPFNLELADLLAETQRRQHDALQRKPDFYTLLGLKPEASSADIKKAYRVLALKYHPDKIKGSGQSALQAEKMFKEISLANTVLSDPEQRARYDQEFAEWKARQGKS